MHLDLTEEETTPLARLLSSAIDGDRFPLSPRIRTLWGVLAKLRPEPAREPLPPPKVYAPPANYASQEMARRSLARRGQRLPGVRSKLPVKRDETAEHFSRHH